MLASSADANTSAGAPPWICVASVPDEPKLNVIVVPGLRLLEVGAHLRERLGERRRGRHGDGAGDLRGRRGGGLFAGLPRRRCHRPARGRRSPCATSQNLIPLLTVAPFSLGSRHFHDDVGRLHDRDREVAGLEPSSSAASRVISDTTRCGPAWMCTTATSPSFSHLGDDAGEPVAGRLQNRRLVARRRGLGEEAGQVGAVDEPLATLAPRRQPSAVGPAPHGVGAHAEQLGRLADPVGRHGGSISGM